MLQHANITGRSPPWPPDQCPGTTLESPKTSKTPLLLGEVLLRHQQLLLLQLLDLHSSSSDSSFQRPVKGSRITYTHPSNTEEVAVSGSLCASGTAIRCTSSCCIDDGMTLMEVWRTCRSSPPMAPGPVSRWSMVQPWSLQKPQRLQFYWERCC
ncbi:hypothetical protein JZ751_025566 [Albula glossodonta]|uniref:Uncharacterized protein n=1 Tax=Albula glossodonta TaxID=121402 RepID=A0A8T2MQM7_9TELE|nr:hypothetical protein JZ751_025566 [Albula glossodonta]